MGLQEMLHKIGYSITLIILAVFLVGCDVLKKSSSRAPVSAETTRPITGTIQPQGGNVSPLPSNATSATQADPFLDMRLKMVAEDIESQGVTNPDVLKAMRSVPRHDFVPPDYLDQAYENHPLPIGYGQTISQPFIVAWMTELLELKPGERVLEIGTGSGYQAAVLAELRDIEVFSIEIVPELAESATRRLKELGYSNIHLKQGDGYYGWPEESPFDAIIVTAAPDHMPAPLAAQLAEGGRMVIPIGPPGSVQTLWKFVNQQGELKAINLGLVAFVPLTGGAKQTPAVPQP